MKCKVPKVPEVIGSTFLLSLLFKKRLREFPNGIVVRIPGFQYCGLGSVPGWGTKILQAVWGTPPKKKKRDRLEMWCFRGKISGEMNF